MFPLIICQNVKISLVSIILLYEVQSESFRTVLVVLFVFNEESQNFAYEWEKHFSTQ